MMVGGWMCVGLLCVLLLVVSVLVCVVCCVGAWLLVCSSLVGLCVFGA